MEEEVDTYQRINFKLIWGCGMRMGGNRKETKEWILGEENKYSVIWCGTMPFFKFGNKIHWHESKRGVGTKESMAAPL